MPLSLFVTYFEPPGPDARKFRPLLERWAWMLKASGCQMPVGVLTDTETREVMVNLEPANPLCGSRALVVDPAPFADVMRPGNPYDRKSALICAALPHLPPALIVDTDAFFQHDPTAALARFEHEPFAMAEDAGKRDMPLFGTREQSSSVMVFGAPQDWCREEITEAYRHAWHQLSEREAPPVTPEWLDAIREQRAWSVVRHRMGAPLLPRVLNWSRFWGPNPAALIHHAHGPEKWTYRPPALATTHRGHPLPTDVNR